MALSRYKHVSYHASKANKGSERPWVAQVRVKGKRIYQCFSSEAKAAAFVAACLKVAVSELRKPTLRSKLVSRHRGVTCTPNGWRAHTKHRAKHFSSETEAVKQVAKWRKVSGKSLRKKISPFIMCQRIKVLMKLYVGKLPADLEQIVIHSCRSSKQMFALEPTMIHLSALLKYGGAKRALLQAWKDAGSPQKRGATAMRKDPHIAAQRLAACIVLRVCFHVVTTLRACFDRDL